MRKSSWKDNNTLIKFNEFSDSNFLIRGISNSLKNNDFEVVDLIKIDYGRACAELSLKFLSDKNKKLIVEWNSPDSGWRQIEAASRLYYNVYNNEISEDDPNYWELTRSHLRFWYEDDENFKAEQNVINALKDYMK
jgi:translation initiation factor 2 alpha subunit (eIF-2alpha)